MMGNGPTGVLLPHGPAGRPGAMPMAFLPIDDGSAIRALMLDLWHLDAVPVNGRLHGIEDFEAIGAYSPEDTLIGVALVRFDRPSALIGTVNALAPGFGAGRALVEHVAMRAADAGCAQLSVVVSNDNLAGLRFFQCNGFALAALYPRAIDQFRHAFPHLPHLGQHGIPMRDILCLERAV